MSVVPVVFKSRSQEGKSNNSCTLATLEDVMKSLCQHRDTISFRFSSIFWEEFSMVGS